MWLTVGWGAVGGGWSARVSPRSWYLCSDLSSRRSHCTKMGGAGWGGSVVKSLSQTVMEWT